MLETLDTPAGVAAPEPPVRWNVATRVAFRFSFLYFGLYVLTTQMLFGLWIFPKWTPPDMGATGWMKGLVAWVAAHVFHVVSQYSKVSTGSGDKTIDWIHAFCLLAFSAMLTVVWSIADRRRPHYAALHKWFHVFLRFAAGTTMVGYGMVKAFPLQMPAPQLTRLLEPYGNFSPMGVLWYSVGASFPYERFAGSMELTAAALLFVPRLSVLGAMVLVADSIQIFTLNMTYDVPVKLFSFHLILIGLVLLAPHMRRLFDALALGRAAGPAPTPLLARRAGVRRALTAAQILLGAAAFVLAFVDARKAFTDRGPSAPKPALYGIWTVEKMEVNGVERAPLVTDWGRWRRVVVQNAASVVFWRMDDTFVGYPAKVDPASHSIALTGANKQSIGALTYQQPGPDVLILSGDLSGEKVRLETRLLDHNKFLLLSRGFHWVQEFPFNR